jgi:hypothetical protein
MELNMKTRALVFAAAAVALGAPVAVDRASAEPVTLSRSTVDDGYIKTRKHCDQRGRCWTEGRRNPLLDSYNYAPPPKRVASSRR